MCYRAELTCTMLYEMVCLQYTGNVLIMLLLGLCNCNKNFWKAHVTLTPYQAFRSAVLYRALCVCHGVPAHVVYQRCCCAGVATASVSWIQLLCLHTQMEKLALSECFNFDLFLENKAKPARGQCFVGYGFSSFGLLVVL